MNTLSKLEFNLLNTLEQLDTHLSMTNAKILLNIQVSGGKDSMVMLHALWRVLCFHKAFFKNRFECIVQHFNHNKRGQESEEDMHFVVQSCLALGVPVFAQSFPQFQGKKNFQNFARRFRKQESIGLCQRLKQGQGFDAFYILTAHHARDHVESLLLHMIRGCGIQGLQGIAHWDETKTFFRPFAQVSWKDIDHYCTEKKIRHREDSSNQSDVYSRNYIRHHILPHIEKMNPSYEIAFEMLSNHARRCLEQEKQQIEKQGVNLISRDSQASDVFDFFQTNAKHLLLNLTFHRIHNIWTECQKALNTKHFQKKSLPLKQGQQLLLEKTQSGLIKLTMITHLSDTG